MPSLEAATGGQRLRVVTGGLPRPDLERRRELKYVFPRADVGALRSVLRASCRPLQYAGPCSTVRSIYFDDFTFGDARRNLAGVGKREKTRLRWYDSKEPQQDVFLEVKWRQSQICGKHRLQLRCDEPLGSPDYRGLFRELHGLCPGYFRPFLANHSAATVLVEYQREHFASREGTTRLTLDYGLCFYSQVGHSSYRRRFPVRLPGLALIEVKAPEGEEVDLPELLGPLKLRAARFSKYVAGCQQLGLIRSE